MSDKTKIYIIDFEDSFTFNIATELYHFEKQIEVISHEDFFSDKFFLTFMNSIKSKIAIILGPGPGTPEDYRDYFNSIKDIKNNVNIYLMGICLGHQLLGLMDGLSIRTSQKPMHGGQEKLDFDNVNMLVQRYNSLALFESSTSTKELQIRSWKRGVSYQFHPESIGTENRSLFFKDLLNFIN